MVITESLSHRTPQKKTPRAHPLEPHLLTSFVVFISFTHSTTGVRGFDRVLFIALYQRDGAWRCFYI